MVLNAGSNHLSREPLIARSRTLASPLSPLAPSAAVDNLEQSILAPLGFLQLLLQLPDLLLSLCRRLLGLLRCRQPYSYDQCDVHVYYIYLSLYIYLYIYISI